MTKDDLPDPCLMPGVQPLINELQEAVSIRAHESEDPARPVVEGFIRQVFLNSHGARLGSLYPTLLSFRSGETLRGAVGVRGAGLGPLFAEQYLPAAAETLITAQWGRPTARDQLVEVGNLALGGPGEARWLIAAVTTYLYACGYRWVLFTAVRPLVNAFARLGLTPVQLADADPARLPDGGRDWGRYYDQRPAVCVGDIHSGYRRLNGFVSSHQPMLHALLDDAFHLAHGAAEADGERRGCAP